MSFVTQINVSIKSYLSSYLEEQLTSISAQKIVIRQASVVEPLRRLPSLLRCMCALLLVTISYFVYLSIALQVSAHSIRLRHHHCRQHQPHPRAHRSSGFGHPSRRLKD
jgi:hypothetical protein